MLKGARRVDGYRDNEHQLDGATNTSKACENFGAIWNGMQSEGGSGSNMNPAGKHATRGRVSILE